MQVKIFESTDMASGLKLVKDTLGPDALILSTRTIRSGKMGLLGKPTLEITAAVDSPWPEARPEPKPRRNFSQWADDTAAPIIQPRQEQAITYDSQFRLHREPVETHTAQLRKTAPARETAPEMLGELDELKEMVKKLGMEMSRLSASQQQATPSGQDPAAPSEDETARGNDDTEALLRSMLLAQGISETTATRISALTESKLASEGDRDTLPPHRMLLEESIRDFLHVAPQSFSDNRSQRRIALVGPTGVGKTTTLAKIAAHYLSNFSSSIALITIDTYRIAAVEQLKVYGAIMNLPVEVVITPEQLEQALARHSDKALILIDTAGRSPRDSLCIEELATFLRPDLAIDKHLVLSATTRKAELFETIKRFGLLGIDNTIITKTDECSTLGVMLDIQMHDQDNTIPFSYITNGQRVPEDLLTASRELVAELIMNPFPGNNQSIQTSKQ